ncbi:MAG: DJ-1/PfpI family protein [bacterium]|nr:DJ-1/PfpI family protein [bacterium]
MKNKIILVIASHDFQQVEYMDTKEELEKANFEVITVSDESGDAVAKDCSTTARIDLTLDEIDIEDYDAIYLIGGPGAMEYLDNEKMYAFLNKWKDSGKPFGSICISTRILAKAGVLQGIQATGWNGDDELPAVLVENGADYVDTNVMTEGNITTASGPLAAHDFGREIVKVLTN